MTERERIEQLRRKMLELTVQCSSVGATRADGVMGGEHALNEDLIKTLHYFLYRKGEMVCIRC